MYKVDFAAHFCTVVIKSNFLPKHLMGMKKKIDPIKNREGEKKMGKCTYATEKYTRFYIICNVSSSIYLSLNSLSLFLLYFCLVSDFRPYFLHFHIAFLSDATKQTEPNGAIIFSPF